MIGTDTSAVIIATRESRLAIWQAEHVKALLEQRFGLTADLLRMTTQGDDVADRTLSKIGGKGLFVKELETALAEGRADLAVHSLKDVPMDLPPGFELAAVLQRDDPRDALVSARYERLSLLPKGARVGTSSLRRVCQLRALRPDLRIEPLRGNVHTRLRKLDEGGFDAVVLAAAGLKRLGLWGRVTELFALGAMIPSGGQGALAVETFGDLPEMGRLLAKLTHRPTLLAVTAERAVARALGGSCSMPLAAHAELDGETMRLCLALGHPSDDGAPLLKVELEGVVADEQAARELGDKASELLLAKGAHPYLGSLPLTSIQRRGRPLLSAPHARRTWSHLSPMQATRIVDTVNACSNKLSAARSSHGSD